MTMSDKSLPTGQASRPASTRRPWDLGAGDPAAVLAGARRALFVMVGVLAVLWIIQIINSADHYSLTRDYGIRGRDVGSLANIITAPFLHFSWAHIEGNSGPLFIFGFLAAYRGVAKFIGVTVLVVVTSGLAAWFSESPGTVGAGASGVVFGYFGYIIVRGIFDRHAIDVLIGAVMALCFAYQFTVLLPHAGIGWQAHIGGLVGGVLAGWVLRERRAAKVRPAGAETTGVQAAGTTAAGVTAAGTSVLPAARPKPGASRPKPGASGPYSGPRADLHKELDDLGL
jgi:membrane associated rhomboid family serine protease